MCFKHSVSPKVNGSASTPQLELTPGENLLVEQWEAEINAQKDDLKISVIELKNDLGKINNYLSGTHSLQQDRDDISTVNNRNQDYNTVDNRSDGEGLNAEQDFSSFQDLTEVVKSQ